MKKIEVRLTDILLIIILAMQLSARSEPTPEIVYVPQSTPTIEIVYATPTPPNSPENDEGYITVPKGENLLTEIGAIGAYYGYGVLVCQGDKENPIGACMHELGHMADDSLDMPSQTYDFMVDINYYMENEGKEDIGDWETLAQMIDRWPGIRGNGLRDGSWGGYGELYASMWSTFTLQYWDMPPVFERYFVIPHKK